MENGSDYHLSINIKTWNKETEDLYDFESKDVIQSNINVDGNSTEFFLIKTDNSIIKTDTLKDLSSKDSSTKFLCHVVPSPKNYFDILSHYVSSTIHFASSHIHCFPEERREDLWLKLSNTQYTTIKIGDIIKIGRVRIKLSSKFPILNNNNNYHHDDNTIITSSNIYLDYWNNNNHNSINNNNNNAIITNENNLEGKNDELSESRNQNDMCRICYRSDSDFENPLIAPCKCIGSMRYIHHKCLQNAISSKFTILHNNNHTLVTWKGFECEICLSEYPKYMIHKNKTYSMINYSIILFYEQYIIFDYFIYDDTKMKANRKGLLIINNDKSILTSNGEITIGRTQTNQVKLKNISVSRIHCSLKISNGNVMIKDNNSKFGTLLYLQHKYTLINEEKDDRMELLSQSFYYGNSCIVSSGRFSIEFQLSKSINFFTNFFLFNCCKNKALNDSSCVIELNEESDVEEDLVHKNNIVINIYDDHILFIDTILQATDPSPI